MKLLKSKDTCEISAYMTDNAGIADGCLDHMKQDKLIENDSCKLRTRH